MSRKSPVRRGDHRIDMVAIAWDAMKKYGFKPQFENAVMREIGTIDGDNRVLPRYSAQDLRALLWSSIDNIDSMDLDQMEYCEREKDGSIHVQVAIADVDIRVPKDSRTDRHAAHNGASIYLDVVTFPMLPLKLSAGITSLLPGKDCPAVVVDYRVLPDGTIRYGGIRRAIVTNRAKLVYEQVGAWLEGTGMEPESVSAVPGLAEQIRLQNEAAVRLRQQRTGQGALDLQTIEAQAIYENGVVKELTVIEMNAARSVIEEFMVAANRTMMAFLSDAGIPRIERVVRVPKNWDGIVLTAAALGGRLPAKPDVQALARFLDVQKQADPERFPDLSLTVVKLMGPGEYAMLEPGSDPIGHFALAVTDYTHGTAPNRRYTDLIIQRLIKSVIDKKPSPYTVKELGDLCLWLTEQEKQSKKVERFMRKAAAAVLLRDQVGKIFTGLVTGASGKGTYVRLTTPPAEGRVIEGQQGLRVGQKIHVRLLNTDPFRGYIDFAYTGNA
ncbi:MAG: RNB domain-containing ribonuclease [Methanoregula sp.]|nr:RNB domain-containing ribonuclease [Methanoregula sp.]